MRMSVGLIRSLVTGCCELREEAQGLFADRMNAGLGGLYSRSDAQVIRARAQAGVRLRFRSNTRALALGIRFGRACRPFFKVDLFVDGRFHVSAGPDSAEPAWQGSLFKADRRRARAFELWLPYSVESWLALVELDDGAALEPLPPEPRAWLAIGDSITQGMHATSPSRAFAALAARQAGLGLHNVAVGGAVMEAEAGAAAAGMSWDLATVAFGCNDWNRSRPLEEYEAAARGLLGALRAARPAAPIGLMTPLPVTGRPETNSGGAAIEDYRAVLRRLADGFKGVTVIEGAELIPADPGLFQDGVHPNDRGMAAIAERLAPSLAALAATA